MLQKLYAFLARAPALAGITLAVGDAGPAPGTAGLWCKGVTVLEQQGKPAGHRAPALAAPSSRCASACRCRPGTVPPLPKTPPTCWLCRPGWPPSVRRAVPRSLARPSRPGDPAAERANWTRRRGGTAVYSLRIRAEYTQLYTEETP